MDVRGKYFLMQNDKFANTWEIWNNPSLITLQKPEIYLEMAPGYTLEHTIKMYFHPGEVIGISNYFVADSKKYNYDWQIDPDWPDKSGYKKINDDYRKVRANIFDLNE